MKTFSIINSIFYDNIYREHGKYKIKTDKPLTNFYLTDLMMIINFLYMINLS